MRQCSAAVKLDGHNALNIKKRTFGVVGLGNFGSSVAKELQRFGNHVIGIDISEARVANL
ncbi:NAD-binding protein, partial [Celeribacter sp.]|uniref:NAD-binding protein n=1 Tax=Celeribacter sp. TaxID=1890673 RepID=UPI003A911C75